jgi:hypothetical protein
LDTKIYAYADYIVDATHIIDEGGNREFNGKGTLLMNLDVEMVRNTKLAFNLECCEDEYKRLLVSAALCG